MTLIQVNLQDIQIKRSLFYMHIESGQGQQVKPTTPQGYVTLVYQFY